MAISIDQIIYLIWAQFLSSNLIYTTLTASCPLAIQHQSHSHAGLHLVSMHTSLSSDRLLVLLSIIYVAVVILIFFVAILIAQITHFYQ